jgi:hypothetical protein
MNTPSPRNILITHDPWLHRLSIRGHEVTVASDKVECFKGHSGFYPVVQITPGLPGDERAFWYLDSPDKPEQAVPYFASLKMLGI